jgi:hypothetical protein
VLIARLRDGARQGLTPAVGQKQQVSGTRRFAPLVANGRALVFGQRMAAIQLNTR